MSDLQIAEYASYDEFAAEWANAEPEGRMLWDLLDLLDDNQVLVELPEWLAEEKVGFVDGATPTRFIGSLDQETEDAIKLGGSADANSLLKLAHRIHHLEDREPASSSEQWLESRLEGLRREFRDHEDAVTLADEWLPKSQLQHVCRQHRRRCR